MITHMYSDSKVKYLSTELKKKDSKLFAQRDGSGIIHLYREKEFGRGSEYVCSLTDNWTVSGGSVDWGIVPINHRLSMMDISGGTRLFDEMYAQDQKVEESKKRDMSNHLESFCQYEMAPKLKKAFSDINTSSMDKKKGKH